MKGATSTAAQISDVVTRFNPRTPEDATILVMEIPLIYQVSIHEPSWVRPVKLGISKSLYEFQSTCPLRSATGVI